MDANKNSPYTSLLTDKISLFEFSSEYKLKRKICDILRTDGKMTVSLSSILTENNFFKYDYKNIREATADLLKEKEIFTFLPQFKLSEDFEDEIFNKNNIEFDLSIMFNNNCIKKDATDILEAMSESANSIKENNKGIAAYYLYRLLKEERCYFYPVELFINELLDLSYNEFQIKDLLSIIDIRNNGSGKNLTELMKTELFLVKENNMLNFTHITGEESLFFNQKEIDNLIDYNLKAKNVTVMFLRQNLRYNIRFNSLMEEIISYFNEFLLSNPHIIKQIKNNLPPEKKEMVESLDIFNIDDIIRTLIDRNFLANYHLPEKNRKELFIIASYISENQKFFLDNIELSDTEGNFSKDLKEEIRNELKQFLSNNLARMIVNKNRLNFIFTYQDFLAMLYKSIKKDKTIVLNIFNTDIRNKYCFFMYLRYNEDIGEIDFFDSPLVQEVVIIPVHILREIAVILIRSEFSISFEQKENIFIFSNLLKLIMKKPQFININMDSDESIKQTGFHGKNDIRDIIELLDLKYSNIKNILKEDEIIALKEKESSILKKHRIFNSIRLIIVFFQKIMLRDKYNKNIKNMNIRFEEKLIDKEIKDAKNRKKAIRQNVEFKSVENESDRKKIAALIENMDDDEKKLFSNIYNCIKNKGTVEYEYRNNRLNVEIYLKPQIRDGAPQMYIALSETLHDLAKMNFVMLDTRTVRLTERIKRYFALG